MRGSGHAVDPQGFVPVVCADLELSDPQPVGDVAPGTGLVLLVRLHGEPLGELAVAPEQVGEGPGPWALTALTSLSGSVRSHLLADGVDCEGAAEAELAWLAQSHPAACARRLVPPPPPPTVDVIVCSIGGRPMLRECVKRLLAQDYEGEFNVIVVDNAPDSGAVRSLLHDSADLRLRVIAEPARGLSRARNAGLAASSADVVAFTDDDVFADPGWVRSMAAVLVEADSVVAATGLVMPGSMATPAEQLFERGVGFSKGFSRAVWTVSTTRGGERDRLGPRGVADSLFPFAAGCFGSGNSMAFKAEYLRSIGGFDEALGAGTPSRGGEDLDVFFRTVASGRALVYEPRAVVRHYHRAGMGQLRPQMVGYGMGLSAYLVREACRERGVLRAIARRIPVGARRMLSPQSQKNAGRGKQFPRELALAEVFGLIVGPWMYAVSRHREKHARTRARRRA